MLTLGKLYVMHSNGSPVQSVLSARHLYRPGYIYTVNFHMKTFSISGIRYAQIECVFSRFINLYGVFQSFTIENPADIVFASPIAGHFNVDLIISESGIPFEINWIKEIIPRLVAAGAPIDAVGFQAHGLKGTSAAVLKSRLDDIYNAIKLPMLISEYDIGDNDDQVQVENYQAHIPVMWDHPGVAGITIWGYILGATWVEGIGLNRDGQERPALTWLRDFINDNPNPPNDYPDFLNGGVSSYGITTGTRGLGAVTRSPDESHYEKDSQVTLTATPFDGWVFDSWSGDASGDQNPLTITMDAAKSVTAIFITQEGGADIRRLTGGIQRGDRYTIGICR